MFQFRSRVDRELQGIDTKQVESFSAVSRFLAELSARGWQDVESIARKRSDPSSQFQRGLVVMGLCFMVVYFVLFFHYASGSSLVHC